MDSLTHIVIGGCIGQVIAGKTLGRRAILLGIIGQSIPDIDFISGLWMNEAQHILAHRGFTHSILFAVLAVWLLAWASKSLFHQHQHRWHVYILLFAINIFVHVLLDTCNAYGTALFYPFSDTRFSFHLLFVADPLFSLVPFIAFCGIVLSKSTTRIKNQVAGAGLLAAFAYIAFAMFNKYKVEQVVQAPLLNNPTANQRVIITPTLFNNLLWYIIVQEKDGYNIGYRSVFDRADTIAYKYFAKNEQLLQHVEDTFTTQDLVKFADGFYTLEQRKDSLLLNVLRFGQIGWQDSSNRFAFYYFLNYPKANQLTIQRGRFERMNEAGWRTFLRRIRGN